MKKFFTIIVLFITLFSYKGICVPVLSSFPSARATIFLDFDGQHVEASSWNGGNPLDCAAAPLTDAQITEIFNRVSEDYRPFNINITTDSTVFLAAPIPQRIRIIITPTSGWYTGVGGVAYTGSFTWGDDTPAFVFSNRLGPNNTKIIAECCTHESGHTIGLSHQSKYDGSCNLVAMYNVGTGTGQTGWAPVMGNSYYENFSGWSNGPTPNGCNADQDNLSIITSYNGFTYRPDDHSDNAAINPTVIPINNSMYSTAGIITTNTDKDVFEFNLDHAGSLHIDANPYSVGANNEGADLDIKLELLDANFQSISSYDPVSILNVVVDTTLSAGAYYLVVEGAGNSYTTNYGSLGSYTISGVFAPLSIAPIKQVKLSGKTDKEKHILSWNIIADEPVSSISLESSANGTTFTMLTNFPQSAKDFSYTPLIKNNIYYRLKTTSVTDQTIYSNVVSLQSNSGIKNLITVSTFVHSEITINATEKYEYTLADMNGRIIQSGKGNAGNNIININNRPNGVYLIRLMSNNQRTAERIVKL